MRIYKHQPLYLIQLTFRRGKEQAIFLTLCDTDIPLTKALLQDLFQPGKKVKRGQVKTRIEIRERLGGKPGKQDTYSFYGDTCAETRRKLINYLNQL